MNSLKFYYIKVVLFNLFSLSVLATNDELHYQCLKELQPFELCDLSNYYGYNNYNISICEKFHEAKCPEFFESPFKFAPTCEKSIKNNRYRLLNMDDVTIQLKADYNLMCAKKDSQSSSEYCNIYRIADIYNYCHSYDEPMDDSVKHQLCHSLECRKHAIEFYTKYSKMEYYNTNYKVYSKEDDYKRATQLSKELIDYLSSDQCESDEALHEQCLKELEPFDICDFDFFQKDTDICDEYYQAKCPEFYDSPYKFAPTCKKVIKNHHYSLLNYDNTEWFIGERKFLCAKKDPQSSNK